MKRRKNGKRRSPKSTSLVPSSFYVCITISFAACGATDSIHMLAERNETPSSSWISPWNKFKTLLPNRKVVVEDDAANLRVNDNEGEPFLRGKEVRKCYVWLHIHSFISAALSLIHIYDEMTDSYHIHVIAATLSLNNI